MALHFVAFPLWDAPVALRRWGRPSPQPPYRVRGRLSPANGREGKRIHRRGRGRRGGESGGSLVCVAFWDILGHSRYGKRPVALRRRGQPSPQPSPANGRGGKRVHRRGRGKRGGESGGSLVCVAFWDILGHFRYGTRPCLFGGGGSPHPNPLPRRERG